MEDKSLIKVCLFISLVGIVTLMVLSYHQEPSTSSSIGGKDIDKVVKISGEIKYLHETKGTYKLTVDNTKVTVFKTKKLQLKNGDYVEITGKVQEYKNQLGVIADKIITR